MTFLNGSKNQMEDEIQASRGLRSEHFSWDVFGFWENECFKALFYTGANIGVFL
jgi:hypothetical protein